MRHAPVPNRGLFCASEAEESQARIPGTCSAKPQPSRCRQDQIVRLPRNLNNGVSAKNEKSENHSSAERHSSSDCSRVSLGHRPLQAPAIAEIFDYKFVPGAILATSFPMTCGSCSPAAPSGEYERSNAFGPVILISHRSFACDPMIETRQSPSLSASTCSMIARTSACRPESPACCISTEIAIPPENITPL